ncbi:histone demethylase PWA37_002197 [Arxiozyma heterogenica]|uniref:histone demethylase n=1 Tax=Arxiozyma heterogenica TaxID=278026 RepID=UPI002EEF1019
MHTRTHIHIYLYIYIYIYSRICMYLKHSFSHSLCFSAIIFCIILLNIYIYKYIYIYIYEYTMTLENVPTLYPSFEDLNNPIEYLSRPNITRLGFRYGLIKLVPPSNIVTDTNSNAKFDYVTYLNKDTISFNPRLQNLPHLNLLYRARLFFVNQLYNFFDNIQIENVFLRKNNKNFTSIKPFLLVKYKPNNNNNTRTVHFKLYFYDLFIELVKQINHINNNEITNHNKYTTFHTFDDLILLPLTDILNNNALWLHLAKKFKINKNTLLKIFGKYLSLYYDFLYHFNIHTHILPKIQHNSLTDPVSLLDSHNQLIPNDKENHTIENIIDNPSVMDLDLVCHICGSHILDSRLFECQSCNNWFHENCFKLNYSYCSINLDSIQLKHCHECVIGNSIYGFPIDDRSYTITEFKKTFGNSEIPSTQESIDLGILEKEFWSKVNNCTGNEIIKYGADIPYPIDNVLKSCVCNNKRKGKSKEIELQPINLLNLPNNKNSLLKYCKNLQNKKTRKKRNKNTNNTNTDDNNDVNEISGMTLPWLYVGSKFSTFCWHMEDQYTLSANYQHEGAPKIWYSVSPQSCFEFGKRLYEMTPDLFLKDNNLIHQLTTLVSPYDPYLNKTIHFFKVIQYPGEFIITFPQCYHSGFNTGYNLNEAVNFTTDFWLDFGMRAVSDYKYIGKPCVFNIYLLLELILKEFLTLSKVTNWVLYRDSYHFLLNYVNIELKRLYRLKEMNNQRNFISSGLNSFEKNNHKKYVDNDDEIICSKCQTMCTYAYYVSIKENNSKEKPCKALCLEHGLQQASKDSFKEFNIHVIRDVTKVLELLSKCSKKLDQF